jgi:hypothetical protein
MKTFSLDFSFATFVRISVGPKCLAALEQTYIIFRDAENFIKKKNKISKNTISRRKMKNILEYFIWKMKISKLI